MAVHYGACVQHNAWSGGSGGGYILSWCQGLFDGWPKLSQQSAPTSVWLLAKFCWAVSLDQSSVVRIRVICSQSNLNEGSIYWLNAVLQILYKDIGFFLACTLVSFCSRLTGLYRKVSKTSFTIDINIMKVSLGWFYSHCHNQKPQFLYLINSNIIQLFTAACQCPFLPCSKNQKQSKYSTQSYALLVKYSQLCKNNCKTERAA